MTIKEDDDKEDDNTGDDMFSWGLPPPSARPQIAKSAAEERGDYHKPEASAGQCHLL